MGYYLIFDSELVSIPDLPGNNQTVMEIDKVVSLHIQKTLKLTGGRIYGPGGAAELLGQNPSTLRSKIKKLGLLSKKQKQ